jgi:6-phosphogluconolactonase/glucosamine-6-phosphate isomerase/deaminase
VSGCKRIEPQSRGAIAQVTFFVAGQSKAAVVKEILGADSYPDSFPAAKVSPADG